MLSKKSLITIVIFIGLLVIPIIRYWPYFCCKIDISQFEQKYSTSQYILGEASPQKISDSELYIYAGYAYFKGEDPTTINFEHPPLAKYFYGLSYWLTNNPFRLNLVIFAGILWLFYQLSSLVVDNWLLKLIGLVGFGTLALVQVHLRYALLDLPLLFGYLLFFYGLLNDFTDNKRGLVSGLGLGIAAAVKYPFPLVGLLVGFLLMETIKNKVYKSMVISLLTATVIYFSSYTFYFVHGHNLFDWLAFEKYRFNWFMGKTSVDKFLVFQTLFTGSFDAWWGEGVVETTRHWSLIWPITFLAASISFIVSLFEKHFVPAVLILFSLLQLFIYSLGAAASDRFFITLLPFWILGTIYGCDMILKRKHHLVKR